MRRITTWLLTTITAVVLLFSYHTSTESHSSTVGVASERASSTTTSSTRDAAPTDPTAMAGSPPTTPVPSASSAASTVTGTSVDTRYGPVQVEIIVTDGAIADAAAIEYPAGNGRDQQINSRAVPLLEQETVEAGSADIDMVSGATYTSEGYVASLQSAIDQAHLA